MCLFILVSTKDKKIQEALIDNGRKNVHFKDTTITLYNRNVHFNNVTFTNTNITDMNGLMKWTYFSEAFVNFSQVTFQTLHLDSDIGILFQLISNLTIHIENCIFDNFNIFIEAPYFWMQINDTFNLLKMGRILIQVNSLCFLSFSNFSIRNQLEEVVSVKFYSKNLDLEMINCSVENTFGGIAVEKIYTGLVDSLFQVKIVSSGFVNNTKKGSGAAVNALYYMTTGVYYNHIVIEQSTFIENRD